MVIVQNLELRRVADFFNQLETLFKRWKESVALDLAFDERQIQIRTQRQRLRVNLRAAANENLTVARQRLQFLKTANRFHTGKLELRTAQDNRFAIRQRLADGLKRFTPHDDDVAGGRLLEPLEILRQMPRDFVPRANHAVQRHGGDGVEGFHFKSGSCRAPCQTFKILTLCSASLM